MNFYQITLAICLLQLSTSAEKRETFSAKLFNTIAREHNNENTIISPASIRTALALVYIGAEGNTADELRRGLDLGNSEVSKVQVAEQFANLMSKIRSTANATVKMANRIYVRKDLKLAQTFNDVAKRYFKSGAESVKFSQKGKTAKKINNWVKKQTDNKIQNLISSESIDAQTAVILVNALYFNANWVRPFRYTSVENFYVNNMKKQSNRVDMMHVAHEFLYADFYYLNAKALSMKYVGTDIQMLVLLPNELDGLRELEQQLRFIDLTALKRDLEVHYVNLCMPKFKLEFKVSLVSTLEALGMKELFRPSANFSGLLKNSENVAVSDVLHKAFIEVHENGTLAAGATAVEFISKTASFHYKTFRVDHPFYFALLDSSTVYFAGHVVNI